MGRSAALDPALAPDIERLVASGMTVRDVTAWLGTERGIVVVHETVRAFMRRHGITPGRPVKGAAKGEPGPVAGQLAVLLKRQKHFTALANKLQKTLSKLDRPDSKIVELFVEASAEERKLGMMIAKLSAAADIAKGDTEDTVTADRVLAKLDGLIKKPAAPEGAAVVPIDSKKKQTG